MYSTNSVSKINNLCRFFILIVLKKIQNLKIVNTAECNHIANARNYWVSGEFIRNKADVYKVHNLKKNEAHLEPHFF